MFEDEIKQHLITKIIPFWKGLRDKEYGGYYGYYDHGLHLDKQAVKGCILNSRILWFFSSAYALLQDESLRVEADHAYAFLKQSCLDKEYGGMFWSVSYDGVPFEDLKHTYNQAFAIYALAAYYDATGAEEALQIATDLYLLIETKCRDAEGYLEALDRSFHEVGNEKLSENGVMARKTMNTLLHVFEAYTELYRVTKREDVKKSLQSILDTFADKVYNEERHRQEVFFDEHWNTLIDLHSYGHDIETSWLMDYGLEVLGDEEYTKRLSRITADLRDQVYKRAFVNGSLLNECENGVDNTMRIWWVQAEAVLGFLNGYKKEPERPEYLQAALQEWEYIKNYMIDKRENSEWFWQVDENGKPDKEKPIVEPWKCPYHNGRMCLEILRRYHGLVQDANKEGSMAK